MATNFTVTQFVGITPASVMGATGYTGYTGPQGAIGLNAGPWVININGDVSPAPSATTGGGWTVNGDGSLTPTA